MLRSVQSWSPASSSRACIARSLHRGNAERISASMLGHGLGCPADMAWSKFMLPTSLPVLSKAFFNFDTSFILSRGAHMHHSPNNCHSLRCWSFINIGNPYGAKLLNSFRLTSSEKPWTSRCHICWLNHAGQALLRYIVNHPFCSQTLRAGYNLHSAETIEDKIWQDMTRWLERLWEERMAVSSSTGCGLGFPT